MEIIEDGESIRKRKGHIGKKGNGGIDEETSQITFRNQTTFMHDEREQGELE